MIWRLDPRRPGIDGSTIRCPDCGQTYDDIVAGFVSLPARHYPQPTRTQRRGITVGSRTNGGHDAKFCPATGNDLVQHLHRTQVAAELAERESAA